MAYQARRFTYRYSELNPGLEVIATAVSGEEYTCIIDTNSWQSMLVPEVFASNTLMLSFVKSWVENRKLRSEADFSIKDRCVILKLFPFDTPGLEPYHINLTFKEILPEGCTSMIEKQIPVLARRIDKLEQFEEIKVVAYPFWNSKEELQNLPEYRYIEIGQKSADYFTEDAKYKCQIVKNLESRPWVVIPSMSDFKSASPIDIVHSNYAGTHRPDAPTAEKEFNKSVRQIFLMLDSKGYISGDGHKITIDHYIILWIKKYITGWFLDNLKELIYHEILADIYANNNSVYFTINKSKTKKDISSLHRNNLCDGTAVIIIAPKIRNVFINDILVHY